MISYELYCQIRSLHQERGLNFAQIARELHLDQETVAKWVRAKSYTIPATNAPRKCKLDPDKVIIQRWLRDLTCVISVPTCTGSEVCFSRLWVLRRP